MNAKRATDPHNPVPRLAFTIREACIATGLGRTSLFQAIRDGKLQVRKAGRCNLILADDLRAFLHDLRVRP